MPRLFPGRAIRSAGNSDNESRRHTERETGWRKGGRPSDLGSVRKRSDGFLRDSLGDYGGFVPAMRNLVGARSRQ